MYPFNPYMLARPAMQQQMPMPSAGMAPSNLGMGAQNLGLGGMPGLNASPMVQQPGLNIAQHPQMIQQMQQAQNPLQAGLLGIQQQPGQQPGWWANNRNNIGQALWQMGMQSLL